MSLLSLGCAQNKKDGTEATSKIGLEENREISNKTEQPIEENQSGADQTGEEQAGDEKEGDMETGEVRSGEELVGGEQIGETKTGEERAEEELTGKEPTDEELPGDDQADEENTEELGREEASQRKEEFLGTDYSSVEYIVMTLDEIRVYYDLLQDYQMEFAIDLGKAFYEGRDKITLGEDEELSAIKEKGYVSLKPTNYYLDILFAKTQTVILGDKHHYECDIIMIDLTDGIIYISLEGEYTGILYIEEDCFGDIRKEVESVIDSVT